MSYDTNPPLIPLDTPSDLVRIQTSFHTLVRETLADKLAAIADPGVRAAVEAELDEVRASSSSSSLRTRAPIRDPPQAQRLMKVGLHGGFSVGNRHL